MKRKNVPRSLANLPEGYQLDAGDIRAIKKYRDEKKRKQRKQREDK